MLFEIANAKSPIAALVEFAMRQKGATVSADIVARYADLLDTAIQADDGRNIEGKSWGAFVSGLDGESKFEAAVRSLAVALNASESDVQAFLHVTDAVVAVKAGDSVDAVSATLEADLAAIPDQPAEAYAHLDVDTQAVKQEVDRALGALDPSRPEPNHIAQHGGENV